MSNATAATAGSGCGFGVLNLLGIAFVVLKLIDKIDWSWWWVLAPFWIQPILFVVLLVVGIALAIYARPKTKPW